VTKLRIIHFSEESSKGFTLHQDTMVSGDIHRFKSGYLKFTKDSLYKKLFKLEPFKNNKMLMFFCDIVYVRDLTNCSFEVNEQRLTNVGTHHGLRGSASPMLTATGLVNG